MYKNITILHWIFVYSLLKYQSLLLKNIVWLRQIFGKWIYSLTIDQYVIDIFIDKKKLKNIIFFLKNHTNTQLKILTDIVCIDYPGKQYRFELIYLLLSFKFSSRLRLRLQTSVIEPVDSITGIFKGSSWLEREVWDLFGVFFFQNKDLRRILTDYGFDGHPLRKDFPLTGFLELSYVDSKKKIIYEPVSLAQEFRNYSNVNPWLLVSY